MSGGEERSGWRQRVKSVFKGHGRSSSSHSDGKTSGASSLAASTVSGSVMSLPSGSSRHDSNSLTPTGSAIISGASLVVPEQLFQSRQQQTMATESARINTQDSRVLQSSAHTVMRDEAALYGGPTLLVPSMAAQGLDSAEVGALAGPTKVKDGSGPGDEVHPPGEKGPSKHGLGGNTPALEDESPGPAPDESNPPTEPQSTTPKEPSPGTENHTPPISPPPEPNTEILASIHVTIEEIKSAQKVLQEKKWYYTDRHGKQVDVGERMRRILKSVEDCAKIVDVAVQHHPEISSLVWAGARFILMVALNGVQFMDNLEAAMVTIVEKMATCEFYAQIYDEGLRVALATSATTETFEVGLDAALKDLYAAVRAFLDKAKEYFDPENNVAKKIVNHLKPFSVTMQPLIQDILDKEKIVEKYAGMATMERIKEDSGRLKQVRDVIMQIREEMKPLAKLDEILNVAKDVRETLVEFQTQVVQALQPSQREFLTSKSLDSELQDLKARQLADAQKTDIFNTNLYVPSQGMATQHAPEEEHFDLWDRLQKFMAPESPQTVCLLLGAAGAGKSTFNHYIATRLWEAYDNDASSNEGARRPIPVFIPLANFHDPARHNQDLVAGLFRRHNWSEETISRAREQLQFVLILDGYDEIEKQDRNFYIDNQLEEWDAKTVITSRPEYLSSGYQTKFHPLGQRHLLQEYWLAPFSRRDITEYISKYVQVATASDPPEAPSRSVKDYEQLVERPELQALISNPFLLKMVMTVQPSTGEIEFKRVTLYRRFLDHWLQSAQERLWRIQLPSTLAAPFHMLCDENFTTHAEAYCLAFAVELYRHKSLEASYVPDTGFGRPARRKGENVMWGRFLSNEDPKTRLLRYSSPLIRVGQSYRFLHKSLRDFAVAQSIWQDDDLSAPNALLNEFPIVDDHGIIDFIVEEAEQNQELQAILLKCVDESKQNPDVATAAANAITVLVRAGKRFHEYDLRGIRIPGADISTGWFQGAQMQGADLRRVRSHRIWLRGADLTGACIDGGEFGEKPNFRLEGKPRTCFYTAEGELLVAAATKEHHITVWSATNRKLLHTFKGHTDDINCVAFLPNGDHDLLATASDDRTVRLWSRQNDDAQLVHTFNKHTRMVNSVAFSPNARFLASGDDGSMVYLWSVAIHSLIHTFSCSEGYVWSVAFSPDGQTLASASQSSQVALWSTESGKLLHTLRGHSDSVRSVTFSPNGHFVASVSHDKSLKLWLVSDGQLIHSFTSRARGLHTVVFAPDSKMIATASGNSVHIWSAAARKVIHIFEGVSVSGSSLAFSRDGELIATGADDRIIGQWLVPREVGGLSAIRVGNGHTKAVYELAFAPDKKLLASASGDGTVKLWSIDPSEMPNLVNVLELSAGSLAMTFSPDNTILVTGAKDGKVYLHRSLQDKTTSSQHTVLGTHTDWVRTVAMTADGNILASGSDDKNICLWSIQNSTQMHTLEGHKHWVRSVGFSSDGELLVSGSDDKTIRLWSVPRCELLHIFSGHTDYVMDVAFSPGGDAVASASWDNTVRLWSVPDRKSLHIFEGHPGGVMRIAFSPDGFLLASGSRDKTLRFWSLSSLELVLNVDIQVAVMTLAWTSGLIAIGTENGGVQLLQVSHKPRYSRENPGVELSWLWATDQGAFLNVVGARIDGVTGLNPTSLELLKQRGAVGEPVVGRVQEVEEEA